MPASADGLPPVKQLRLPVLQILFGPKQDSAAAGFFRAAGAYRASTRGVPEVE